MKRNESRVLLAQMSQLEREALSECRTSNEEVTFIESLTAQKLRARDEYWIEGLTRLLDEHPEDWDGPCECRTCLSYGN
jgi:hypothetical protein